MNLNDTRYTVVPERVRTEPFLAWLEEVNYCLPYRDWLTDWEESSPWILTLYEWFLNDVPACEAAQEMMVEC